MLFKFNKIHLFCNSRFGICLTRRRSTNPKNPPTIRSNPNRRIRHVGCRMKATIFSHIWKANEHIWKIGSGLKGFSGFISSSLGKYNQTRLWPSRLYRVFHGFGQAKFAYGGSILGSSQFTLLLQLSLKRCSV